LPDGPDAPWTAHSPSSDSHHDLGTAVAVFLGGGQVGADGAEVLGVGRGSHAPGDLDPQFSHPDLALGRVVVEWCPGVSGKPQVVVLALTKPAGPGVVLTHEWPGA